MWSDVRKHVTMVTPKSRSSSAIGRGSPSVACPSERINNTFRVAFASLKTAIASFNALHIGVSPKMYGLMGSRSLWI